MLSVRRWEKCCSPGWSRRSGRTSLAGIRSCRTRTGRSPRRRPSRRNCGASDTGLPPSMTARSRLHPASGGSRDYGRIGRPHRPRNDRECDRHPPRHHSRAGRIPEADGAADSSRRRDVSSGADARGGAQFFRDDGTGAPRPPLPAGFAFMSAIFASMSLATPIIRNSSGSAPVWSKERVWPMSTGMASPA